MNYYQWIRACCTVVGWAMSILLAYRFLWGVIGFFTTRRFPKATRKHRYAVLIAARNEETVLGPLLDSLAGQDYDGPVTVFVVADNCQDRTASVAREKNAVCYERFDPYHRTKGYALQYLLERIRDDYGIESFEGYFVFDADNLLMPDYISRMNDAFDAGEKIVTSYRNTKNMNDGAIAAGYALHWLASCRCRHRPRSVLRLSTNLQGTGMLFANELVRNGWPYTSFTEDRAFSADATVKGYRISYNEEARFYDEQPNDAAIALRQRLRWSKGHLMAFAESGWSLFKNIFRCNSFACYDMFWQITPVPLLHIFKRLVLLTASLFYYTAHVPAELHHTLFKCIDLPVRVVTTPAEAVVALLLFFCVDFAGRYLAKILLGCYVWFTERRQIQPVPFWHMVADLLLFPCFYLVGYLTLILALFMKVEWKPIPHKRDIRLDEIKHR